jgi:MoaA/NifB/PqqE/SkfB family radical SAM enzyme
VDCFYRHNRIRHVSVPTNGLLPARIAELAQTIAAAAPELEVSFNLSIDGFAETNDRIRGMNGAFERATESLARLSQLRAGYPNLRVVVNTVICADTISELVSWAHYMAGTFQLDGHFFELIRGMPREDRLKSLSSDALYQVYKQLLPIQEKYLCRRTSGFSLPYRLWRRILGTGQLVAQYRHQYRVFTRETRWPFPCRAGDAIAVVDYDGSLRVCELRDRSVALDTHDWDFEVARDSPIIREERLCARQHVCDCTHVCFLTTSLRHNLIAHFVTTPWRYVRYKLTGDI